MRLRGRKTGIATAVSEHPVVAIIDLPIEISESKGPPRKTARFTRKRNGMGGPIIAALPASALPPGAF
jgi:hypothetical protein